jgi:hypothetical protein
MKMTKDDLVDEAIYPKPKNGYVIQFDECDILNGNIGKIPDWVFDAIMKPIPFRMYWEKNE